jgi:site-specific DNA recombinase
VAALRTLLGDPTVRSEAAAVLSTQIESVTIYPDKPNGPEAEAAAFMSDLMSFAANENSPRRGGDEGCSTKLVAGTGFEPVTFRL